MICEYRNFGCNATIGTSFEEFEDIDLHEQHCLFRPIECFHHKCQNQKFKLALYSILDHFRSTHHGIICRAFEKIHSKKKISTKKYLVLFSIPTLVHVRFENFKYSSNFINFKE